MRIRTEPRVFSEALIKRWNNGGREACNKVISGKSISEEEVSFLLDFFRAALETDHDSRKGGEVHDELACFLLQVTPYLSREAAR